MKARIATMWKRIVQAYKAFERVSGVFMLTCVGLGSTSMGVNHVNRQYVAISYENNFLKQEASLRQSEIDSLSRLVDFPKPSAIAMPETIQVPNYQFAKASKMIVGDFDTLMVKYNRGEFTVSRSKIKDQVNINGHPRLSHHYYSIPIAHSNPSIAPQFDSLRMFKNKDSISIHLK